MAEISSPKAEAGRVKLEEARVLRLAGSEIGANARMIGTSWKTSPQ